MQYPEEGEKRERKSGPFIWLGGVVSTSLWFRAGEGEEIGLNEQINI